MKNERILLIDDQTTILEDVSWIVERFGKEDGHIVVGKAQSLKETEELLDRGLKPTLAMVDNDFCGKKIGSVIAESIRKKSPDTKIISFSSDLELKWADENWDKHLFGKDLIKALTDLQH